MNVAVIGTGYVGVASALGFAHLGHRVAGYDCNEQRVRDLQAGRAPYHELGLTEFLLEHLRGGNVRFTGNFDDAIAQADTITIAVGTPANADGSTDLRAVEETVDRLSRCDLRGTTVAVRSTLPPGTCDRIADRLSGCAGVVYAPEFLREGSAVADFLHPDRIVIGARDGAAAARFAALFESIDAPVVVASFVDAELAKTMSNAYLAMKITFANQVANLCDRTGGDALAVLAAVGADRRIGKAFLHPGIGFGGPCFEKDLRSSIAVAGQAGVPCDLLDATLALNERQPRRVREILEDELGRSVAGLRVGVWGLTFKGGTDDVRDSLAVRVVDDLHACGADITAYDPSFPQQDPQQPHWRRAVTALDAAVCDALVVLTDWPQFAAIAPGAYAHTVRSRLVVDGRNVLDADAVARTGLRYRGVGRRRSSVANALARTG